MQAPRPRRLVCLHLGWRPPPGRCLTPSNTRPESHGVATSQSIQHLSPQDSAEEVTAPAGSPEHLKLPCDWASWDLVKMLILTLAIWVGLFSRCGGGASQVMWRCWPETQTEEGGARAASRPGRGVTRRGLGDWSVSSGLHPIHFAFMAGSLCTEPGYTDSALPCLN